MPPPPPTGDMWGFVWGFDLINLQIFRIWGKSYEQIPLLLRASNHDHLQFLTNLHSDMTEMFILLLENKINADSNLTLNLVARIN